MIVHWLDLFVSMDSLNGRKTLALHFYGIIFKALVHVVLSTPPHIWLNNGMSHMS